MKVTKKKLITEIAGNTGIAAEKVETVLMAFSESIIYHLCEGDTMEIDGIGVYKTRVSAARTGRNPYSGESIEIPEKIVPTFKFAKYIKEAVEESGI